MRQATQVLLELSRARAGRSCAGAHHPTRHNLAMPPHPRTERDSGAATGPPRTPSTGERMSCRGIERRAKPGHSVRPRRARSGTWRGQRGKCWRVRLASETVSGAGRLPQQKLKRSVVGAVAAPRPPGAGGTVVAQRAASAPSPLDDATSSPRQELMATQPIRRGKNGSPWLRTRLPSGSSAAFAGPVTSRAPRWRVAKLTDERMKTRRPSWKPMRKKRGTMSQVNRRAGGSTLTPLISGRPRRGRSRPGRPCRCSGTAAVPLPAAGRAPPCGVAARPYGDGRDDWYHHRRAVALCTRTMSPSVKTSRMSGQRQVGLDGHATCPVPLGALRLQPALQASPDAATRRPRRTPGRRLLSRVAAPPRLS